MTKPEELAQLLLEVMSGPTEDEHLIEIVGKIAEEYPEVFDRYDVLSEYIYQIDDQKLENIKKYFKQEPVMGQPSFQKLINDLSSNGYKDLAGQKSPLRKFERHVKLACSQRDFIQSNIQRANNLAKNTKEISDEAHNVAKNAKRMARTAEKVKGQIYSEFIAILGIFTAISFMSMGSLQVLGDLFKDVKDPNSASIGYALIVGGIYIIVMYVFVIVMFVGMKKVVGNGDRYNFSTGICALVLIAVATLIGIGLLICGHLVSGLMIITLDVVGVIVAILATQKSTDRDKDVKV